MIKRPTKGDGYETLELDCRQVAINCFLFIDNNIFKYLFRWFVFINLSG